MDSFGLLAAYATLPIDEAQTGFLNLKAMYLKIHSISLVPDQFGQYIKINRVGLYDEAGKWIKWVKLNETTVSMIKEVKIPVQL